MDETLEAEARKLGRRSQRCSACHGTGTVVSIDPNATDGYRREPCRCGPSRREWVYIDGSLGVWTDIEMRALIEQNRARATGSA